MTAKEQQLFSELQNTIRSLEESNRLLANSVAGRVDKVENSLSKKNEPIFLENDIIQAIRQSIGKAIVESLNRYGSPLEKLCEVVINKHEDELKNVLESSIISVFKEKEFISQLNEELAHKAARVLIDSSKGICDSITDELKRDNVFRAKLTIVVSDLIEKHRKDL